MGLFTGLGQFAQGLVDTGIGPIGIAGLGLELGAGCGRLQMGQAGTKGPGVPHGPSPVVIGPLGDGVGDRLLRAFGDFAKIGQSILQPPRGIVTIAPRRVFGATGRARPRFRLCYAQGRGQNQLLRRHRRDRGGLFACGACDKAANGCKNILDLFGGFRSFRHHHSLLDTAGLARQHGQPFPPHAGGYHRKITTSA